jgi:hypothetical protein
MNFPTDEVKAARHKGHVSRLWEADCARIRPRRRSNAQHVPHVPGRCLYAVMARFKRASDRRSEGIQYTAAWR